MDTQQIGVIELSLTQKEKKPLTRNIKSAIAFFVALGGRTCVAFGSDGINFTHNILNLGYNL